MFFTLAFTLLVGQCLAQSHPWIGEHKDAGWMKKHQELLNLTLQHGKDEKVVFIGDSITDGWQWDARSKAIWAKHYTPRHAYNYGISGDRTEHVIWRIENKEFDGLNPKVVILMIGTNNLGDNTIEDIDHGVKEILHQLSVKMPSSKVILLGVLPRNPPNLAKKAKDLNVLLKKLTDEKTVFWLDMWMEFGDTEGKPKDDLFLTDHLHPNYAGYDVWQKTMEPLLSKLDN